MLNRILPFLTLFVLSSGLCHAQDLSSLTDKELCTELGVAAAHKDQSLLSSLEAEGIRRDKMQVTRINSAECNQLVVNAVNSEMHPELKRQNEKLAESVNQLEVLRKQAQSKAQ